MMTRGILIALVACLAGCEAGTAPPYNPGFGDAPPEIDRTNHGDYRVVGSAVALVNTHDAAGQPTGELRYTALEGPAVEMLDAFDRSQGSRDLEDGRVEFRRTIGGTFRLRLGDRETDPVSIWDGNPRHEFPPFTFASFGKITVTPNPTSAPTVVRFPTGGYFTVRLVVEGDPSFGSPVPFQRTLLAGPLDAGDHAIPWDLRDGEGRRVPPGIYRARLYVSTMGWLWHEYLVVG